MRFHLFLHSLRHILRRVGVVSPVWASSFLVLQFFLVVGAGRPWIWVLEVDLLVLGVTWVKMGMDSSVPVVELAGMDLEKAMMVEVLL